MSGRRHLLGAIMAGAALYALSLDVRASAAPSQTVATRLEAIERRLERASVALDPKPYEEFWAPDFVGIGPDGSSYTKAQHLAALTGGHVHFQSIDVQPVSTRVYRDAAVLINRRSVRGTFDGKSIDSENLVTNVYIRDSREGWRKVSEHSTRLH